MHDTGQAVLPFGWGLSFTNWSYSMDTVAVWNKTDGTEPCTVALKPVQQYVLRNASIENLKQLYVKDFRIY